MPLEIRNQALRFSFYPMRRGERRWGVSSMLYTADPWALIAASLPAQCQGGGLASAQSFVRQSREYFAAADNAEAIETKPVLFYYCFLNLAKALGIARAQQGLVGTVLHGIRYGHQPNLNPLTVSLTVERGTANRRSVYGEFHHSLTGHPLPTARQAVPLNELMPQSLVAHRMWAEAANRRERFVAVDHVELMHNARDKALWAVLEIEAARLARRGRGINETLKEAGINRVFRAVKDTKRGSQTYRRFEQIVPQTYTHRAADNVMNVVDMAKRHLWRTITAAPPYRRYYLYLSPLGEVRLAQPLSIYALFFFFGSLTRYRPEDLLRVLEGPYSAFIRDFLASQPLQMVYGLASEFKRQEVTRAAVV